MKKVFFLLAFMVATFSVAQAQSGVGIRGGANLSNLEGDLNNESRYENKWGFHAGVTYNIGVVEDFFSIQPELIYSQKGFRNSDEEFTILTQTYKREGRVNYNYIDLPVLAKIKAGPLYFEAGPQASYLVNVNNNTKEFVNGTQRSSSTTQVDRDGMKKFELGYAAGIGLTTGKGLSHGVRYNGSFSDFVKDAPADYFDGDLADARHSTFMLTVGIALPSR